MWTVVFTLLAAPFTTAWNGYVLSVLWGWFMVPTFGLPALSVAPSIGVALMAMYLTHQYDTYVDNSETPTNRAIQGVIYNMLRPALCLGFGWIVTQFM